MAPKQHHIELDDLLTTEQVATIVGVSAKTIRDYRARGLFPEPKKIGSRPLVRWPRRVIEAWLAE